MQLATVESMDTDSELASYVFFEVLVHYVKNCYFRVLESASYHILYNIQMLNHGTHQLKWFKYEVVPYVCTWFR